MKNLELARAFEQIASLLEILGESPFKIRAYRRAARTLVELPESVEQAAAQGRLRELPGVGEAIESKILQYLSTGRMELLERLKGQVPEGVLELLEIPGVGPKTARLLLEKLDVRSAEDLEAALRAGRLRTVKGLGARAEQSIREGMERWKALRGRFSLPQLLAAAEPLAAGVAGRDGVTRVTLGGAVRRCDEVGSGVELVVGAHHVSRALASLQDFGEPEPGPWEETWRVARDGPTGVPVTVWVVPDGRFAAACLTSTGPAGHVEGLVRRLAGRGLSWHDGRILRADGAEQEVDEEEDLYRLAGLPWIAPELRWGEDELELAERGLLPDRLVEVEDIRGDLHVHTRESDGTASLPEMAEAARARGLSYLAITDHSPSLTVARGLSVERLEAQLRRIENLDGPPGLRVLSGTEVDVHPDGHLDYPDEVLARLDVVVASIHTHFRMSDPEMTRRLVAACESPWVHILGHPTGRLLGRRDPYPVDLEAVLRRAAETGTAVEINASPDRLDLSPAWARQARRLGVRLVISTDAHSPAQLAFMRYGVLVARRAGLGPGDLLNTLRVEEVLARLKGGS